MGHFNDRFLRACWRQPTDCTPVWFMRQAGRALPEYRALRERYSLLDVCRQTDLIVKVTLLPVRRLGVDAAILFSDLTLPFLGMGVSFSLQEGVGPVVGEPVRSLEAVERLRPVEPEADFPFLLEAVQVLRQELEVPLIGFVGGAFTLACYLVEGFPSRDFPLTRGLMLTEPPTWHTLMERLTEAVLRLAHAQVRAGVHALQVFDSWVGVLSPDDYQAYVLPYMRRLFAGLAPLGVPCIYFGTGTAGLLEDMAQAGADVIGLDWRVRLDEAWRRLGYQVAVQGNLEPAVLLADFPVVAERARDILRRAGGRPGHIFNLGHGVLPQTPSENLARLVDLVHEATVCKGREML
ncbi:Uroporphyrinogen decarboxylase [bacterium HR23]|nr:Uroporphyrinogen decarboxylase [bacterium HR23]